MVSASEPDGMSVAIVSLYAFVELISWYKRHYLSEYGLSLIHDFYLLQYDLQKYKIKSRKNNIHVTHRETCSAAQCCTLLLFCKTLCRNRPIQKDFPTAPRLRLLPVGKTFCYLSSLQKKLVYCPPFAWVDIFDKREN